MGIACKQCGAQVEAERECYATPMCFACLPPPKPLPKTYTQQHVDELTRERDDLRRHYDAAAPEHNLLALLDLYHDRQCAAERERDEALCRLDHAEADAEQAVSITISERDEARAEVERLKSRVQSISSSVEHHAKTAAASERAAIVAYLTKSERGMKRSRNRLVVGCVKHMALTRDLSLLRRLRAGISRIDHHREPGKDRGE